MANIPFKRIYHIHEVVGATQTYESFMISDPETGCGLAAVDEEAGFGIKLGKAFLDKSLLPVKFKMLSSEGSLILDMYQPVSLYKPTFTVKNAEGCILCMLRSNSCRLKPSIDVLDERNQVIGSINGDWRFNSFQFNDISNKPIARISHCITSLVRELFTTADDYDVEMLSETPDTGFAMVALAATIAIDVWFHE